MRQDLIMICRIVKHNDAYLCKLDFAELGEAYIFNHQSRYNRLKE